jgi:hypothetical protein
MEPDFIPYIFLIPLAGIMLRFFKEWLRFKAQHKQLGSSTEHLETTVAELRTREQELTRRLENLEAIVVSQTWDAVHDRSLPPVEKELRVASAAQREMAPLPEPDSQKAEVMARRLRA